MPPRRDLARARIAALGELRAHTDQFLTPSRHLPARLGLPASYLELPLLGPVPPAPPPGEGAVRFLFLGDEAPPEPFPGCGEDPTPDVIDCVGYGSCQ